MYCISCGSKLPDNARYCAQCGAKVPSLDEDTPSSDERSDDVIEVEAIVPDSESAGDEVPSCEEDDSASEGTDEGDSAPEGAEEGADGQRGEAPDETRDDRPARQGSGPLNLPEIDPASPFARPKEGKDAPYDPFAEQADPITPSYGPLKSVDVDFSLEGDTAKMPRILSESGEVLVEGDAPAKNFVQSNTVPKRWTPGKVALLSGMVLVAIALVCAIVWIQSDRAALDGLSAPTGQTEGRSEATASAGEESQSPVDGSSTATEEDTEQGAALAEDERRAALFDQLDASYEEIGSLNKQVASVVDDYNTYYVDPDIPDRAAASDRCAKVAEAIAEGKAALESSMEEYECTVGTPYYDQARDLLELFTLLEQRVAPLTQSWERSVASTNPAADESYILEPIAQASASNALSRFNALYPEAAPQEEE